MRSFIACHIPERWWRVHIGFDEISPSASSKRDLGTRLPTYIPIKSVKWFNRKWRSVFSACFLFVNWLSRSVAKSTNYKGEVVTRVGHWRMTFWRLSFLTRGYPKSIQRVFFLWVSICKCATRSLCVVRGRLFGSDPNSLKYSGAKALRSEMWEGTRAFSKHLSTGSPWVYFDLKDDFDSNFTILSFELFCNLDHMRSVSFSNGGFNWV